MADRATDNARAGDAMRTVLALGNIARPAVEDAMAALPDLLGAAWRVVVLNLDEVSASSPDPVPADAVLGVVFGGDGAILAAARRLGDCPTPLLGVNLGKLGFLTAFSPEEFRASIRDVLAAPLVTQPRMLLSCAVKRDGKTIHECCAANDAVISRGALSRIFRLDLHIASEWVTTYAGDGLIVSTPTGSTAHSLSAGGPILDPGLEAIVVTPICPHTLSDRPLVVPAADVIDLVVNEVDGEVALTVDGQVFVPLQQGDSVHIGRASHCLDLVVSPRRTFFDTLRTKMNWRGNLDYGKS